MAGVYGNMIIPQKARGGALPEYQGGGAPYTPGAGISARLSGEGGRVAAAAVKAAADADASRGAAAANLARAANNAVQIGLKAYGDYESAVAQNAFNQYQQEEMRLRAELSTLQGRNALGDEGVEARLSRWRADARERLGADLGEIGQRMFHRAADNLDAQSDAWATGKVNKENIAFQNSVSEGSILNARNMALENPADEGALARADGIIKAEYERMASRSGWDDAYRDAKYAEARGKLLGDAISASLDGDNLGAAQTLLRRYGDKLGPLRGQFQARIRAKGRELESRARSQQVNNFLFATSNMDALERMALAEEQFGKDPARKAQYDAIRSGIMHEEKAREDMERFVAKREMDAMLGEMTEIAKLPPEESFARMKEMEQRLPLEKREAFFKAANNIRNPANRDDPLAIEEITERKLSGEVFNVRAEYGSRITSATCAKLEKQGFDKSLHSIREAFNSSAFEYLADDKSKDAAKELGYSTPSALWTRFLASTDADEKYDAVRLKKEADEFFKRVILNESRTLWADKEIQTISGLAGSYVNAAKADERRIVPAQGSEAYGRVTAALQEAGVEPEGTFGGYSEQQLANGYAALLKGGAK